MEKVRPWYGQPSDQGRLKNRTEHNYILDGLCNRSDVDHPVCKAGVGISAQRRPQTSPKVAQ